MIQIDETRRDLERQASTIAQFVRGLGPEEARWKPDDDQWSILEIVCHLRDEEREDFRLRLDGVLHRPGEPFPAIDPGGWPISRDYQGQSLETALEDFLEARRDSIEWLATLTDPDWNASDVLPNGYRISAGDILAAWSAHDLLHLRQLIRTRFHYQTRAAQPFTTIYAGEW